jgi:hypothetical protein
MNLTPAPEALLRSIRVNARWLVSTSDNSALNAQRDLLWSAAERLVSEAVQAGARHGFSVGAAVVNPDSDSETTIAADRAQRRPIRTGIAKCDAFDRMLRALFGNRDAAPVVSLVMTPRGEAIEQPHNASVAHGTPTLVLSRSPGSLRPSSRRVRAPMRIVPSGV